MAKRGRPPLCPEGSTRMQLTMPVRLYERACQVATQAHLTVPEIIRRALYKDLRHINLPNSSASLKL